MEPTNHPGSKLESYILKDGSGTEAIVKGFIHKINDYPYVVYSISYRFGASGHFKELDLETPNFIQEAVIQNIMTSFRELFFNYTGYEGWNIVLDQNIFRKLF